MRAPLHPLGHSKNTGFLTSFIIVSLSVLGVLNSAAAGHDDKFTGIIGVVLTSDGQPAPGVSIYIKELQKGTQTNTSGEFTFKNIAAGEYHLEVSMMGFEKIIQTATVTQGAVTHIKVAL